MAESTYEQECLRAELLGNDKPNYEEFLKNKREQEAEEQEIEILKEAEHEGEQMQHASGGLDELNSILQITQRKISGLKASCGSITNMIKTKLGHPPDQVKSCDESPRQSDLNRALDNHLDKLDAMIDKAENAQYSMTQQNKQMKQFLN